MLAKVKNNKNQAVQPTQKVRCPNCGSYAERHYITKQRLNLTQTECRSCDYLLVNCSQTGRVVEAYAPGISGKNLIN